MPLFRAHDRRRSSRSQANQTFAESDLVALPYSRMVVLRRVNLSVFVGWALTILVCGSNSGVTVLALLVVVYGAGLTLLLWLITLVVSMIRREHSWRLLLQPVLVIAALAAAYTGLLFRIRFFASKPFFVSYVERPVAGERAQRVGLFVAKETEVLPEGVVRIVTTDCMFDDCGVVFSSKGVPPRIGEDSYQSLGDGWWRWQRSW
jgi:hypothetical protein